MAEPTKRCAIYTRKSSEEGLQQEYNSLDAQRDAGSAYIRSQKHEGWREVGTAYDDGGISGGHMDRAGLQRLLADIKASKIDIVVVYKVDRLSRSLADFAQLMQLFDKHGVSFVSVTQQFNTSTSMGRLTLNVLLSFAQFEREVTGERIRDKIALSKQKGIWMGGIPPLGYDVCDRKLLVNPAEAEVVKTCFAIYQENTGLIESVLELNRRGLLTKSFVSTKGRVQQGKSWVAKQLHRVLTNPLYRGMVRHKDQIYSGEHEAIIGEEIWQQVQEKLRQQQPGVRKTTGHLNETAISRTQLIHPLKGMVYGIDGQALTPTYTNKSSKSTDGGKLRKRYRYYLSQQAIRQGYGSSPLKTINATLLEEAVRQMLIQSLPHLTDTISFTDQTLDQIRHRLQQHSHYLAGCVSSHDFSRWLPLLSPKVIVSIDQIQIHVGHSNLARLTAELPPENHPRETVPNPLLATISHGSEETILTAKVSFKPVRGRAELIDSYSGQTLSARRCDPDPSLIQTIAQAEFWRSELRKSPTANLNVVAEKFGIQPAYLRRLINAAYLAPAIKRAIFQGTQPGHLQIQDLIAQRSADWSAQMRELGFPAATACADQ